MFKTGCHQEVSNNEKNKVLKLALSKNGDRNLLQ